MSKAGANDWKTPLGYYERAIAELRKTREEFQVELQSLKEMQASMIELPKLKADIDFLQLEIQSLKAELQATNDDLTTTRKTAIEAQARVEYVETGADVSQTEIQVIKAEINRMKEYLVTVERVANNLPLIELMWVKENYTRLRQILKLFGR
ncbi:MAG TPA: hypothetical protein V6D14_12675 [Coleofasciculaceae cyanobacterium]|jgi:chromosome segregation ATPase